MGATIASMTFNAMDRCGLCAAWFFAILNCVMPGAGVFWFGCCYTKSFCHNFLVALLMSLTASIIIGWIWAVYWAYYLIYMASLSDLEYWALMKVYQEVSGDDD